IYRHGGKVPDFNRQAFRFTVLAVLLLPATIAHWVPPNQLLSRQFALIILWCLYRNAERSYGTGFLHPWICLWRRFHRAGRTALSRVVPRPRNDRMVLIVSPIPIHPVTGGGAARILAYVDHLRSKGYEVGVI